MDAGIKMCTKCIYYNYVNFNFDTTWYNALYNTCLFVFEALYKKL